MRILLYSDVHISKTSSILPLTYKDSKFSFRQNMIVETGKYLANLADENKVDMIINLGDTFDVHTITSYDIVTASEFFKQFKYLNVPHLVLVGNHEMINQDFNAVELLDNIDNITVISEPCTVNTDVVVGIRHPDADLSNIPKADGAKFAFLPYCNYKDIMELPEGDFLFSHQDIQGSLLRGDITLVDGISPDDLKKYKLVFNGHIHKPSINGNIITVGSIMTHSFADDAVSVPQCYIFDTITLNLTTFKPAICPLFRKLDVVSIADLKDKIDGLCDAYKYIINCTCPFNIRDEVKSFLSSCDKVLNHRLNVQLNEVVNKTDKEDIIVQQSNLDISKSFKEFLGTADLKYPKELYLEVLEEVKNNE